MVVEEEEEEEEEESIYSDTCATLSFFPDGNPSRRGEINGFCTVETMVKTGMIATRKSDNKLSRFLKKNKQNKKKRKEKKKKEKRQQRITRKEKKEKKEKRERETEKNKNIKKR